MNDGFRVEFSDFDPATWPDLPPGFADTSWRNDACPSALNSQKGLSLYIDYADPDRSEFPQERRAGVLKRFTLHRLRWVEGEGWLTLENCTSDVVAESDDLADIATAAADYQYQP